MKNKFQHFGIFVVACIILAGCAASIPRESITFDYTPPIKAMPKFPGITFSVIGRGFNTLVPLFQDFTNNLTKDCKNILIAQGFDVNGLFNTYDQMTSVDKRKSDLMLLVNLEFSSDMSQINWSLKPNGLVTIGCHGTLIIAKSSTTEVLWKKSVAITPIIMELSSKKFYSTRASLMELLANENKFHADLGHALEVQYAKLMDKIYNYLDSMEIASLIMEPAYTREIIAFNYTPTVEVTPESIDATFIIVEPQFETAIPLFKDFANNMTRDFRKILTARGYKIKGLFNTYDQITDTYKKEGDFVLISRLEFDSDMSRIRLSNVEVLESPPHYLRVSGLVMINCRANFMIVDSLTNEVLWTKQITVAPVEAKLASRYLYTPRVTLQKLLSHDNKFYADFGKSLEARYSEILSKIYTYFEPAEIKSLLLELDHPREKITFDYVPPVKANPGSAGTTFAVVGSQFETPVPLFKDFANNMTKDFQEILTARGYGIKGPFKTYDEMTYTDKVGSDLVLTAEVKFTPQTQISWTKVETLIKEEWAPEYFRASGPVTIKCHVDLVVYESLTKQTLWTKSLEITPITAKLLSRKKYKARYSLVRYLTLADHLKHNNRFHSDLGHALEAQYTEIMKKIYNYLDSEEIAIVKQAGQDVRKRKVFQ